MSAASDGLPMAPSTSVAHDPRRALSVHAARPTTSKPANSCAAKLGDASTVERSASICASPEDACQRYGNPNFAYPTGLWPLKGVMSTQTTPQSLRRPGVPQTRSKYCCMPSLSASMTTKSNGASKPRRARRARLGKLSQILPRVVWILWPEVLLAWNLRPNSTQKSSNSKATTSADSGKASAKARAPTPQKLPISRARRAPATCTRDCNKMHRVSLADHSARMQIRVSPSS
mmetsp:Transcript_77553/g.225080  ORF Transcript_77553/g.225080 Transcript_77553/m.225080 type:complete len:232 (-) Transcript_77553:16-711(-)